MTYSISGYIDRVAYTAVVSNPDEPEGLTGHLTGSPNVCGLLAAHEGEQLEATPVGPYATLDLTDDFSIMVALRALTDVRDTDGDVPSLDDPDDPAPLGSVF